MRRELDVNCFYQQFYLVANDWVCRSCARPDRLMPLVHRLGDTDEQTLFDGRLQVKKGRWRLFQRWRTCYFTLSNATLTYSDERDVS